MPDRTKVTIFEVAERPWGWLTTSAVVDDGVYVGSAEWRALHPQEWKHCKTAWNGPN
jgi:hypothetical protein